MKRYLFAILFLFILLGGCDDPVKPGNVKTSGIETIDNILYGTGPYHAIGFNFSKAEKVTSLSRHDVVLVLGGTIDILILQTQTGLNGFFLAGEYPDEATAVQAFDNLTAPAVPQWETWANPVRENQVWIYRSADEHYAKLRIISAFSETRVPRDYAECTFEWVYQPDGSLTFPGK